MSSAVEIKWHTKPVSKILSPGTMIKKVLVIVGPTASGKSNLAVQLAKKFNGEIISADSRQIYKDLNIGTGKITKRAMMGVPHHLLDVANPKKQFSAAQYKLLADKFVRYIVQKDKLPIVVGGTGFYIDTLVGKINLPEVPPNKPLREKLDKLSLEKLFEKLKKKDPKRARSIDKHNKVRLIRALEIVETLGKVPSVQSQALDNNRFIYIGVKPNNLNTRIEKRVEKMFRNGLLKEIEGLKKSGITNSRLKELGFEYWNPIKESVIRESKKYAKRQMTWFKRNKEIKWFTLSEVERFKLETYKEIEKYIERMLG